MKIETFSEEETYQAGVALGAKAAPGDIYILDGDLGAGKTVFARGVAGGLLIEEPVNSPTFTIIKEYTQGRLPLYHFDVYRIGDPSEMDELGYEEYFFGRGVCLVEWGCLVPELFPDKAVTIRIRKRPERGFDYREITISGGDGDEDSCL